MFHIPRRDTVPVDRMASTGDIRQTSVPNGGTAVKVNKFNVKSNVPPKRTFAVEGARARARARLRSAELKRSNAAAQRAGTFRALGLMGFWTCTVLQVMADVVRLGDCQAQVTSPGQFTITSPTQRRQQTSPSNTWSQVISTTLKLNFQTIIQLCTI
ncbi:hypothetical protein BJV77DRAFT_1152521, partial [Russula vinacea]